MSAEPAFTLGIEEEYQIIDPQTRELASQSAQLVKEETDDSQAHSLLFELYRCQIEIASDICYGLSDVRRELVAARKSAIEAARSHNLAIAAAGTHPFSAWQQQQLTPKDRYQNLDETLQQIVREMIIFGCHVHVGIEDKEAAIQVLNRSRQWLPTLLALTANSPLWLGKDTGYHSYRMELWCRLPTAGPPPSFEDYSDYQSVIDQLITTGITDDPTKIYWDIRLSERFPTIEFRVSDVCSTVDEAVLLAGIVQAIAQTCYQDFVNDRPYHPVRSSLLKGAMWQAARYGTQGKLIDFNRLESVSAPEAIHNLLSYIRPALETNGNWDWVQQQVEQILSSGNAAQRQRQIFSTSNDPASVVDYLIEQTMNFDIQ